MSALVIHSNVHTSKNCQNCARAAPHDHASDNKTATQRPTNPDSTTTSKTVKSVTPEHSNEVALLKSLNVAIPPGTRPRPCPSGMIPLRTPEGFAALKNAESTAGFHSVAPAFQGQGPLQCGPTSLTVALNALRLVDPMSPNKSDCLQFSKDGVVGVLRSLLRPMHRFFSVSLDEIGRLAAHYTKISPASRVRASTVHTNETTCDKFREKAAATLRNGGMVVVNFSRSAMGYTASHFAGHMSPIVAYNRTIDSFLLMDVAIKSWEPMWLPASSLFAAMNTTTKPRDATQRRAPKRGFVLFERI